MNFSDKQTRKGAALLGAAAILILIGVLLGEPATVLQKSIHICMECIGIG